jgi:hypothetical protein
MSDRTDGIGGDFDPYILYRLKLGTWSRVSWKDGYEQIPQRY